LLYSARLALIRNLIPVPHRGLMAAHQNHHVTFVCMLVPACGGLELRGDRPFSTASVRNPQTGKNHGIFRVSDIYTALFRADLPAPRFAEIQIWFTAGDAMHECISVNSMRQASAGVSRYCAQKGRSSLNGSALPSRHGRVAEGQLDLHATLRSLRRQTNLDRSKVKVADEFGRRWQPMPPGASWCAVHFFKAIGMHMIGCNHVAIDGWWWTGYRA